MLNVILANNSGSIPAMPQRTGKKKSTANNNNNKAQSMAVKRKSTLAGANQSTVDPAKESMKRHVMGNIVDNVFGIIDQLKPSHNTNRKLASNIDTNDLLSENKMTKLMGTTG